MTDAVADIEFFQQQMRLVEQLLYDAERVIEDRDHTIDRLTRENENLRRQAMKFDDNERPEVVFQILKYILRGLDEGSLAGAHRPHRPFSS